MKLAIKIFILFFFSFCFSGCGTIQKIYESGAKLSKDTFELKKYRYNINIVSNKIINQSANYDKNTVKVVVFQLKDDSVFNQTSYYDLLANANSVLSNDLISEDSELIYSFSKKNMVHELNPETKFLGLIFFFNMPEEPSHWKIIMPIKDISVFKSSYVLVDGEYAQLVKKKYVNDLLKKQKTEKKEKDKLLKQQKKLESKSQNK